MCNTYTSGYVSLITGKNFPLSNRFLWLIPEGIVTLKAATDSQWVNIISTLYCKPGLIVIMMLFLYLANGDQPTHWSVVILCFDSSRGYTALISPHLDLIKRLNFQTFVHWLCKQYWWLHVFHPDTPIA